MFDALTITEAGMLNDVQRLHAVSHNLANAGTVGFKKEMAVTRAFPQYLASIGSVQAIRPVMTTQVDHSAGTVKYTGNPLDVAVEERGFFAVATPAGEAYTRQGNFRVDADGRLVTGSGHPVLGTAGEIQLTTPEPRIDADGRVWEGNTEVAQLRLMSVGDPGSLRPLGQALYLAGASTAFDDTAVRVRQGFIETANVVAMSEMIKMIETVRHFETSQRIIRGYDAMLDRAINVGGEL